MPYQHNKKQDRKPTKRTDRPHGARPHTAQNAKPLARMHLICAERARTPRCIKSNTVLCHQPPTQLILHIRCATPNVIYQSGSLSPSSPLSQSHSHSAPAPPAPQANRTTKERLLPRTKLPLKAKRSRFPSRRLHTRHRRGLRSLYQLQRKIQRSGRPRLFLRERG